MTRGVARERILLVAGDQLGDVAEGTLREHWIVESAADLASAIAIMSQHPPSLVLCDAAADDDFEALRHLCGAPLANDVAVLTLCSCDSDALAARAIGAAGSLVRPFSASELVVQVASDLATRRTMRELQAREVSQRGRLYRHFLQAPFPICVLQGAEHVVELANPPILRAWGKTDSVVGQPIAVALPELRGAPFFALLDKVFQTGEPHEGRAEVASLPVGPGGAVADRYYNYVYAPLRATNGDVDGVLVSAFDVTEQVRSRLERVQLHEDERRARQEAEAARARLHSLFMQAPVPICIIEGADHRYVLANQPFASLVGKRDLVGRTVAEVFPERVEQGALVTIEQVYATGQPYRGIEVPLRLERTTPGVAEDGLFNIVYEPYRDLDGEISGVLAVVFDLTDTVRARRASELARVQAESSARSQRELREFQERFVAILGHDLRNPIAAIDIATDLLDHHIARSRDATTNRITSRIKSSSQRMSRMVEQILDLTKSRLEGGLDIERHAMNLGSLLSALVEELRAANPSREIRLKPLSIVGDWDRDRLEQVFSNLIGNAIHHGDAGGPVTVDAQREDMTVQVTIHNEGPPIPPATRELLFSPFRRGERDSRGPKTEGLGLGLYVSRELVRAHGGDIQVHSTMGEGTAFSVRLPTSGNPLSVSGTP